MCFLITSFFVLTGDLDPTGSYLRFLCSKDEETSNQGDLSSNVFLPK